MARPPKYKTAEQVLKTADEYFALCDTNHQLPEKAGLCLALGISRDTYNEYKKVRFPDTIKAFELYIESSWVRRLAGQAATGAIFYLKNAFKEDYRDSHDVTSDGKAILQSSVAELKNDQLEDIATGGKS